MRKLYAKWVPKCRNVDQKRQRSQSSEQIWNLFGAIQMISCRDCWPWTKPSYITMNRRQSNNQWSGGIAAHLAPKNSDSKNLLENSRLDLLGSRRHPPHWLSSKRPTINAEYYSALLMQLKGILKEKHRGKLTKGILFLHDNVPSYRAFATQYKLAYLGFQCLDHPPYSPGLVPSDYQLFLDWKNNWKVTIFRPTWRSFAVAKTW